MLKKGLQTCTCFTWQVIFTATCYTWGFTHGMLPPTLEWHVAWFPSLSLDLKTGPQLFATQRVPLPSYSGRDRLDLCPQRLVGPALAGQTALAGLPAPASSENFSCADALSSPESGSSPWIRRSSFLRHLMRSSRVILATAPLWAHLSSCHLPTAWGVRAVTPALRPWKLQCSFGWCWMLFPRARIAGSPCC